MLAVFLGRGVWAVARWFSVDVDVDVEADIERRRRWPLERDHTAFHFDHARAERERERERDGETETRRCAINLIAIRLPSYSKRACDASFAMQGAGHLHKQFSS